MTRWRSALIDGLYEGRSGLTEFSVTFRGVPVEFGLDGNRLPGPGPGFYITDVLGYKPGMRPEQFTQFGPRGLDVGIKVRCKVSDIVPQGLVLCVKPVKRA